MAVSILCGLLLAGLSPAFAATCSPEAKLRWSGSGNQTTRPFHMDGGWEVQWNITKPPMLFQIMVHDKQDPDGMPNVAANQNDSSPGSAYQPKGGDYYLTFNTFGGAWSACVVPVP